jgi:hypothetical protein
MLAVRGVLITAPITELASSGTEIPVVNLDSELPEILHLVYPACSWIELLHFQDSGLLTGELWVRLMSLYGYRWNDDLNLISQMRFSGQCEAWLAEKSLSPRELAPLLVVPEERLRNLTVQRITNSSATRSQGARLLELLSEILAIHLEPIPFSKPFESEFGYQEDVDRWIQHLEVLRFPTTRRRDEEMTTRLKTLDLPSKVKAEFRRHGDETGVELKISAKGPQEMRKLLLELNTQPWDDAWKSTSPNK